MSLLPRATASAAVIAAFVLAGTAVGRGQTPASAAPPVVVGSGNYSPVVTDLEQSIAFYSTLVGIKAPAANAPGRRPFSTDGGLLHLFGTPGAELGYAALPIPGSTFGVEPVELRKIARQPVHPRQQDPGGATLVLTVRDIDAAFAPLKKAGVVVVTPGGGPMAFGTKNENRGVIVEDPDGHYVELLQFDPPPASTAPATSNILSAWVRMTVADAARTAHLYRDVLGFQTDVGEFQQIQLLDLMNLKPAQLRLVTAKIPGTTVRLDFIELKNAGTQTAVHPRVQDPGATRFQLIVKGLDATMAALRTAGLPIVSTGGTPASLDGGVRASIMSDPDGMFLVLIDAPQEGVK